MAWTYRTAFRCRGDRLFCGSPNAPRRRTCTSSLTSLRRPRRGRRDAGTRAAAFFYSYIVVLVVTLGVNGFFVLAASLAIASALSYSAYHYLVSGSMSRLPEPDRSGLRGHCS